MKMETIVIDKSVYQEKQISKIGKILFFVSVIGQVISICLLLCYHL